MAEIGKDVHELSPEELEKKQREEKGRTGKESVLKRYFLYPLIDLFSLLNFIIYSEIFVVPFCLSIVWILIPIYKIPSYLFVEGFYFVYQFLIWLAFFDLILPGAPLILIFIFLFIFCCAVIATFVVVWFAGGTQEKLTFLLISLWEILLVIICFVIHLIRSKIWKAKTIEAWTYDNYVSDLSRDLNVQPTPSDSENMLTSDKSNPVTPNPDIQIVQKTDSETEPESKPVMNTILSGAGKVATATGIDAFNDYDAVELRMKNKDVHCSRHFYNLFCFWRIIDQQKLRASSTAGLYLNYKILAFGIIFRVIIWLIWGWIQLFTYLTIKYDAYDKTVSSVIVLIVWQGSYLLISILLPPLNDRLPRVREIHYFSFFIVPFLFFFYYRNLFINVQPGTDGWITTVCISAVICLFQLVYYPFKLSKISYILRFVVLRKIIVSFLPKLWFYLCCCCCCCSRSNQDSIKDKLERFFGFIGDLLADSRVKFEDYQAENICEYYYNQLAKYFSLIVCFAFMPFIKYGYNRELYPSVNELSDGQFRELMLRYFYLLGIEVLTDIGTRLLMRVIVKVSVASKGRDYTVRQYRTRFLFGLFVFFFIMSPYYSLQKWNTDFNP